MQKILLGKRFSCQDRSRRFLQRQSVNKGVICDYTGLQQSTFQYQMGSLHFLSGSPSDFFHTAPNSPSEAFLAAVALPSDKPQAEKTSPSAEWTQTLMASSDWSIVSVSSSETKVSDAAAAEEERSVVSLENSTALCEGLVSEMSWQERDSGVEPQGAVESARGDLTLALLGVMEHYRDSIRVTPTMDVTKRAEGGPHFLNFFISK